jgi:hypothetical protein
MYQVEDKIMQKGLVDRAQATAPAGAPMAGAPMAPSSMAQEPSMGQPAPEGESNTTPKEDKAHEAAMTMVSELLYANDKSNTAIMNMLKEDNPAASASEASIFLLSKVEETFKGNYPEALVLPTADEISDMVLELADESGKFEVTEDVAVKAKSLMVQQLVQDYGVDEQSFRDATQDVTQDDMAQYEQMFGGANA